MTGLRSVVLRGGVGVALLLSASWVANASGDPAGEPASLSAPPGPEIALAPPELPGALALSGTPRADARVALPDAALPDIAPPDLPAVAVTVGVRDLLPSALAARLADEKAPLGPRLARREREAIAAFYALGGFEPLWMKEGAPTPGARLLAERLRRAEEDALDPLTPPALPKGNSSLAALVEAELGLSAAAVVYAREARGARIEPARLSALLTPTLDIPAGDAVLTRLAGASDPGEALRGFNPPHAGYRGLRARLADLRAGRLQAGLETDIVANMERWRWLPADLGERHIHVNVPEYRLRLKESGRTVHETRVIVGRPETPTPVFSDEMEHLVVNPSWYVPPSIFKNEFHSDPALAAARGYEVVRARDGGISVRQPPGERNALGAIKFMFPNRHAVYLHDTPNRSLFGNERRAYSHGCVRVDQPFRLAEEVLGASWSEPRLRAMVGKGERTIRLAERLPVHLTYFTLSVDEASGALKTHPDIYGFNNKVRVALHLPADAPVVAAQAKVQRAQAASAAASARARAARAEARRQVVRRPSPATTYLMPAQAPWGGGYSWWR